LIVPHAFWRMELKVDGNVLFELALHQRGYKSTVFHFRSYKHVFACCPPSILVGFESRAHTDVCICLSSPSHAVYLNNLYHNTTDKVYAHWHLAVPNHPAVVRLANGGSGRRDETRRSLPSFSLTPTQPHFANMMLRPPDFRPVILARDINPFIAHRHYTGVRPELHLRCRGEIRRVHSF
jgi:hypothetical protein